MSIESALQELFGTEEIERFRRLVRSYDLSQGPHLLTDSVPFPNPPARQPHLSVEPVEFSENAFIRATQIVYGLAAPIEHRFGLRPYAAYSMLRETSYQLLLGPERLARAIVRALGTAPEPSEDA